jgi:hypothetical protein
MNIAARVAPQVLEGPVDQSSTKWDAEKDGRLELRQIQSDSFRV